MRFVFGQREFLVVLFVLLALLPTVSNPYTLFVGNLVMIYIILAIGLNLLIGYAGQLALANAAMFGIGTYGTALLQVKLGWPYVLAAPGGVVVAIAIGSLIAFPALRLGGIYLALTTLAFAEFTRWVLLHWNSVTFGAGGFETPNLDLSPLPIGPDQAIYYLSLIVCALMIVFGMRVVRSRVGRSFVAIRDGEVAAQALGISLLRYKTMAFALSAFYAGVAGALYSPLLGYVSPEGFNLFQMVIHKSMVVVGGMASIVGSVIGATVMLGVLEALREFKSTQEIVFGAILIIFVVFRPHGLVSFLKRFRGWEEPVNAVDLRRMLLKGVSARPGRESPKSAAGE